MVAKGKKRLFLSITEKADKLLREHISNNKGAISAYVENCIRKDFQEKEVKA